MIAMKKHGIMAGFVKDGKEFGIDAIIQSVRKISSIWCSVIFFGAFECFDNGNDGYHVEKRLNKIY